jgi:hypothetical protein
MAGWRSLSLLLSGLAVLVLAGAAAGGLPGSSSTSGVPGGGASPLSGFAGSTPCGPNPAEVGDVRRPHPPIHIDGNGPGASASPTDRDRPSEPDSGVVAGNGTAGNPYVVEDWNTTRLFIEDTDAHILVRDNHVRVPEPDPLNLRPGDGRIVVKNASNVSLVANDQTTREGLYEVVLFDAPGICLARNDLPGPGVGDPWMLAWNSSEAAFHNNTLPDLTVGKSADLRLFGNAIVPEQGLEVLERRKASIEWEAGEGGPAIRGETFAPPREFDHVIPPSNTVAGDPLRYVHGETGATVEVPAGEALVVNSTDVVLEELSLEGALQTAYSSDVAVRDTQFRGFVPYVYRTENATLDNVTGPTVYGWFASNLTVTDSRFDNLEVRRSPGVRVVNTTLDRGLLLRGAGSELISSWAGGEVRVNGAGSVVRGTTVVAPSKDVTSALWVAGGEAGGPVTVARNRVRTGAFIGLDVGGSRDAVAVNNSVEGRYLGMYGEFVEGAVIANNTVRGGTDLGIWVKDGSASVEDNLVNVTDEALIVNDLKAAFETRVELHGNNVRNRSEVGIRVDGGAVADASGNWWGCPEGPFDPDCAGVGDSGGTVDVTPWLSEPNPQAGADLS